MRQIVPQAFPPGQLAARQNQSGDFFAPGGRSGQLPQGELPDFLSGDLFSAGNLDIAQKLGGLLGFAGPMASVAGLALGQAARTKANEAFPNQEPIGFFEDIFIPDFLGGSPLEIQQERRDTKDISKDVAANKAKQAAIQKIAAAEKRAAQQAAVQRAAPAPKPTLTRQQNRDISAARALERATAARAAANATTQREAGRGQLDRDRTFERSASRGRASGGGRSF